MTRRQRWLQIGGWLLVLVLLPVLAMSSSDIRNLLAEAARKIDATAVLVMLPGQVAATGLCAAALWSFRPGVSFWGCTASRLLRDAAGNMPFLPPGTGEAMGARALVLAGGGTRRAIVASTLDKLAESLAQIPYIMLAAWLLFHEWNPRWGGRVPLEWVVGAVLLLLAAVAAWRRFGAKSALAHRIRAEWAELVAEARAQRSGMPASLLLHLIAWLMGSVQLWLAGNALGFGISPFEALAIESAAYAGRAVLFFVPAGLVAQEAGLLAAGLLFGLMPAQSLALGLAMRIRDLVFAVPLIVWPLVEMRRRRAT